MNFEYKIFDTHSHYDDDAFNEKLYLNKLKMME